MLPNGVRFLARRAKVLADAAATLVVGTVVFLAVQMGVAPGSSPVTFEQVVGEIQELSIGANEIPTITATQGEEQVEYKRVGDAWKEIVVTDDSTTVNDVADGVQEVLEDTFVNDQAGIADAGGQIIKVSTWTPRWK